MAPRNPQKLLGRTLVDLGKTADPRRRLELAGVIRRAAEELERDAVAGARAAGLTWTQIGSAYGMSKQAAQQRFRDAIGRSG